MKRATAITGCWLWWTQASVLTRVGATASRLANDDAIPSRPACSQARWPIRQPRGATKERQEPGREEAEGDLGASGAAIHGGSRGYDARRCPGRITFTASRRHGQ